MNERIRELAEQAGLLARTIGPTVETRHMKKKEQDLEKFAELIVRECLILQKEIELVGLHSEDYEQGVWEGLQMYANSIKRHFGVEE